VLALGTPDEVVTEDGLRALYGVAVRITAVEDGAGGWRKVCVPVAAPGGA